MLTRLRDALADPQHGEAACRRLRERFGVVLVDEFQDTDPVQWDILRRAFAGHATMILIGDPKQAIYAFRGADVFSYLGAVKRADTTRRWTRTGAATRPRRGGSAAHRRRRLGDQRIVVRPVGSAHAERRLTPVAGAPLRLRVVGHDADGRPRGSRRCATRSRPTWSPTSPGCWRPRPGCVWRPDPRPIRRTAPIPRPISGRARSRRPTVEPSDIAVLVRKNRRGEAIRDALIGAGVPAVLLSAKSVFASPMAQEWLTLLRTLEQPRQAAIRPAALTCFLGWTFADLAGADDDQLDRLTAQVRYWSRLLARRGVAALLEAITNDTRLTERLLGQIGGERALTDLRHLGQNLHAAMQGRQLGVSALVEWLRERIDEARRRSAEGSRRLDTEARWVQVLTVHASKGLEFPIVYLPEAWDTHVADDEGRALLLHERGDGTPDDCLLDVGGLAGPGRRDRLARNRPEEAGEDLRLLYVALTRAQCQVVAWWAPSTQHPRLGAATLPVPRPPPCSTGPAPPAASYPMTAIRAP